MGKHTGKQKNIRFSDEELIVLDKLAEEYGSIKSAVMAGLYQLDGRNQPTNKELIEMLKARLG
jgi:ribosomal protein S24E